MYSVVWCVYLLKGCYFSKKSIFFRKVFFLGIKRELNSFYIVIVDVFYFYKLRVDEIFY